MTLEELSRLHLDHLRGLRRSVSTLINLQLLHKEFVQHCHQLGIEDPKRIEPKHFEAYVAALKARQLSPLTVYYRQVQVRDWLRWATLRGHLFIDPGRDIRLRFPHHLPRGAASEEQIARLLDAPDPNKLTGRRDRALMEFLYGTGLRVAECAQVERNDLDFEREIVHVRHGKGDKARNVPIGPKLISIIKDYLVKIRPECLHEELPALWVSVKGTPLYPYSIRLIVKTHARASDLPNFSVHSFRHAYATHLLTRGASAKAIQLLLGHSDLQMMTRYTHLIPKDLQLELARTHPRGRRRSSPKSQPANADSEVPDVLY